MMQFEAAGRIELGNVRTNNEDSIVVTPSVVAVADGVGGRPAGEVASATAVAVFEECVLAGLDPADAAVRASRVVRATAASNSLLSTMCCTLTGAAIVGEEVVLTHVGDSRAWLVADGAAALVTADQTVTSRLVAAGELSEEEAATHPKRHTLFQAIGSAKDVEPDRTTLAAGVGCRLVLATDGILYGDQVTLPELLAEPLPPAELADRLVQLALDGGGNDNVAVVVADIVEA